MEPIAPTNSIAEPATPEPVPTEIATTQPWYCYILRNTQHQYSHLTYNGSTNDPRRRLRQHNEEIAGGARYTHGRNGGWEIYALVTGFVDHKNALSCEWRIKHTNGKPGKRPNAHLGMVGRIRGLCEVLKLDKWTSKCMVDNSKIPYTVYIAEDVAEYLQGSPLPENITVKIGIPAFEKQKKERKKTSI
jgi:predicted GIY-YIG superfamily endonuclease